ncbi:peroxiredoxin [Paracoccus aurantiacus]|uniref:Glutathione-dependent peroxiredoxin n=1 Tax=Paracoccus aurantiacus TaxID=2599412 RepID=A0A5C6RWH7_9RHOB|nr:peroxiredoxin [Paracoccus aurantiacus]TXB66404.1 peroxiredoxin [Paracoccus aurantiacus]
MALGEGDKLPSGKLLQMTENGPAAVDLADYQTGRVAIFALPGAYTGTCSTQHVPSFIRTADQFRGKGVDRIVCISVNDPFVMGAWATDTGADKAGLTFLSDADGAFTKAMGMNFDAPPAGLLGRSKRYAMLVEDGTITAFQAEESPGQCSVSGGESLLERA